MAAAPPPARPRPVFLNLVHIRQPLPAKVSILHRASGALLFFVGVPAILWGVEASVAAPDSFERFRAVVAHPLAKLLMLVLAWAYLHHLLAGLRHLLLDMRVGVELPQARRSAALVLVLALFLTIVIGVRLW